MLDAEKVSKEFVFLREKLSEISVALSRNENTQAAFLIGCLHSICHNHAMAVGQLIQPKTEKTL